MKLHAAVLIAAALASALPAAAAPAGKPGAPEASRVLAGNYKVDGHHTQVVWTVDHMGVSPLTGALSAKEGTLTLDPKNPSAAKVSVTFTVADMTTSAPAFTTHLLSADFFEATKFPTATFVSTSVKATGNTAKISGDLTIKGVTKPVVLDAKFFGAGPNAQSKKLNIGFSGTTSIKRSDFGLGFGVPVVGDDLELRVNAAFERLD